MNTAQTINFDIPIEEVDIPMEPEEQIEDWSEFDNYEFKENEIFLNEYPPQLADWCDNRQKTNEIHQVEEIEADEQGNRRFQYVIKHITDDEIKAKRQEQFEKDFFLTSLGYIRRKVSMATGDTKDFLCDLLPAITTGITLGQEIPIITYKEPDFTQEFNLEYLESLQEIKIATQQFCTECALQISADFMGQPITLNE